MIALGSCTFFIFGIVLTLLGTTQAEMARELGLDLARSGFLGAMMALGMGAGVLIAGPVVDRFERAPIYAGACVLTGVCLAAVGPGISYAGIVSLLFAAGLGCGAFNTIVNAVVIESAGARSAAALAVVHSCATLGATVGPLGVRALLAAGHWSAVFQAIGALHLLLACAALRLRNSRPRASTIDRARGSTSEERGESASASVRDPTPALPLTAAGAATLRDSRLPLLMLGCVTFAYVGVETGLTLFAVPWAAEQAVSEKLGQWSISAFWGGLLLGRLLLALQRSSRGLQLLAACGIAGAAIVCTSSVLGLGPLVLVTAVAGLAIGPVYPTTIALAAARVPSAPGTALGLVAATGACGGFAIPWYVGAVGDAMGVRLAIALLGVHLCVITAAALALAARDARTP